MPRKCSLCIADELTRSQVEQCLTQGESQAEVGIKFGFSADVVQRHAAHSRAAQHRPLDQLRVLAGKIEKLLDAAALAGDIRSASENAGQLARLLDRLHDADAREQSQTDSGFESLKTGGDQVAWLLEHRPGVFQNWIDGIMTRHDAAVRSMPEACPTCNRPVDSQAAQNQDRAF